MTLKDIAARANTTVATVSLVLNGKQYHRVSERMRHEVERIAAELGYEPNRQAQILAQGRTKTVAILVNTLTNSFYSQYVGMLESRLAERDYHVIPAETLCDSERERRLLGMIERRMCDATISLDPRMAPPKLEGGPRVVHRAERFGVGQAEPETPTVEIDYGPATKAMFEAFAASGASSVGLVMSAHHAFHIEPHTPRAAFFDACLASIGPFTERAVEGVSETAPLSTWYDATARLLKRQPKTDAMFIHNAHVAAPVLKAIDDAGRRVGEDMAVGTYDDAEFVEWLGPGLAVVREPADLIADRLAAMTLALLGQESTAPKNEVIEAEFVPRASAALSA